MNNEMWENMFLLITVSVYSILQILPKILLDTLLSTWMCQIGGVMFYNATTYNQFSVKQTHN